MKKLYYDEGPRIMGCGVAGQFKIGVPKEVPDDLAEILIRKGRLKEFKESANSEQSTVNRKKQASGES